MSPTPFGVSVSDIATECSKQRWTLGGLGRELPEHRAIEREGTERHHIDAFYPWLGQCTSWRDISPSSPHPLSRWKSYRQLLCPTLPT